MKGPFEKTKVVVRRLPPGISQEALMEQINGRFSGRYKWVCFRSGNNRQKSQRYARAYVDFNNPEDVVEFAEFFDGHTFVNEKGTQFKTVVEFAPSQRVPKMFKKDGREGTIYKDPEYLEFLELLTKPVENLPSAELQLEKREAERAGLKDVPIVTPLMDFVRQKRAAKNDSRKSLSNGKLRRRTVVVSGGSSTSASQKRGSEKRKVPRSMYVLRDGAKNPSRKEKSSFVVISRRDDQCLSENVVGQASAGRAKALETRIGTGRNGTVCGVSGSSEDDKQIVLLLKGKEKESVASSGSTLCGSSAFKQSPHHEAAGVVVRSILSNEARHTEQSIAHSEKDKRPPRPPHNRVASRDSVAGSANGDKKTVDDKVTGSGMQGSSSSEKQDKRTRNKDRPDRGVWAPLRRSDYSCVGDDSVSSSSVNAQILSESSEKTYISRKGSNKVGDSSRLNVHLARVEVKGDATIISRNGEASCPITENGSHRHGGRRGLLHGSKEFDGFANLSDGKHSKKPVAGYGSHEKQVWVQKTGSG